MAALPAEDGRRKRRQQGNPILSQMSPPSPTPPPVKRKRGRPRKIPVPEAPPPKPEPVKSEPALSETSVAALPSNSSSSSSSSAERGTAEDQERWGKLVGAEWIRISAQYDKEREAAAPAVFRQMRTELAGGLRQRFATTRAPVPLDLSRAREPQQSAAWTSGKSVEKGGGGTRCQLRTFPPAKALPNVMAWLPLPHNIWQDDSATLTHIPAGTETDAEFVRELIDHYEFQVHGVSNGDFINDKLLFKLLHNLQKIQAKQLGKSNHVGTELPKEAFDAVASYFPDKGSAKVLRRTKFADLLARYAIDESRVALAENMAGDVDAAEMEAPLTAEKALHSYSSLFCPRCFAYDCTIHNDPTGNLPKRKVSEKEREEFERENPRTPCSTDCHRRAAASPTRKAKTPKSPKSPKLTQPLHLKNMPEERFRHWTNSDITMFRTMRGVYGEDFCSIRNAMLADHISCKEVAEFAAAEGPISPLHHTASPPTHKHGRSKSQSNQHHRFRLMKWGADSLGGKVTNQFPFTPCVHPAGEKCGPDNCSCKRNGILCMKFCQCCERAPCPNRFPGCRCRAHCTTKQCPCFMAYRECDPDLCLPCGAADLDKDAISCQNVNIQRGWGKKLLQGPSEVAGWGMFLGEPVAKGGFVSEYCGEVISQDEADRRGKIYDRSGCSYLFNLNSEQAVDATRKGNQIRFANHSSYPNCATKVLMVNGDHRIGIFAKGDLRSGEELFFDYRYKPGEQLQFVSIERPRLRNNPE